QRQKGVTVRRRRITVVISRRDIEHVALWIDGGARPDGSAGRSPHLSTCFVFLCRLRFFSNRVCSPHLIACRRIQRHQAPPEPAAFIIGGHCTNLFSRCDAYIQSPVKKDRRSGHTRERKVIYFRLPEQCAGGGVESINIRGQIAEQRGIARTSG